MWDLRWHSLSDATLRLHNPESEDLLNAGVLQLACPTLAQVFNLPRSRMPPDWNA